LYTVNSIGLSAGKQQAKQTPFPRPTPPHQRNMGRSLTSLPEPKVAPPHHNRINLPCHPRQRQSLHHSIPPILSKHLRALRRRSSFDCKRAHPALQIDRRVGVRVLRLRRSCVKSRVQIPRMNGGRNREDVVVGAVVDGAGKGGVGADEFPVAVRSWRRAGCCCCCCCSCSCSRIWAGRRSASLARYPCCWVRWKQRCRSRWLSERTEGRRWDPKREIWPLGGLYAEKEVSRNWVKLRIVPRWRCGSAWCEHLCETYRRAVDWPPGRVFIPLFHSELSRI